MALQYIKFTYEMSFGDINLKWTTKQEENSSFKSWPQNRPRIICWLFPELRSNKGTYIILSITRHNESLYDIKSDDLHTLCPCLVRSVYILQITSQSVVGDVAMTRQVWHELVKWIISNSLDVDLIHGDFHGQSCKKIIFLWPCFLIT